MPDELLSQLPRPAARRLAVRVTPDAERQVRGGHPWVFDGSITSVSHEGAPGDLAVIFDRNRDFLAIGLWDPTSAIRVRVLHAGSPQPIDDAWWTHALERAIAIRDPLAETTDTDAYRLVHGENDGLPGLVVDRYAGSLVVKVYSTAWFAHLAAVTAALAELTRPDRVVLRWARTVGPHAPSELADGGVLLGPGLDGPVSFHEHGLRFEADLARGHKTGHFLDQRDNRRRIGERAAGATVLDVFSCTGGFTVHAAAGGATEAHLVDRSAPALAQARSNLAGNADHRAVAACRTTTSVGDAFAVLEHLGDRGASYDIVVVDPPSFASRRADRPAALSAYRRLSAHATPLVRPGGLLFQASCSSQVGAAALQDAVRAGAAQAGVSLQILEHHAQPIDHPVGFAQGHYLDALLARVD